ncbi:MAG: hypothetical protein ACLFP8_02280 [Alphaproteobacteria bacterium]
MDDAIIQSNGRIAALQEFLFKYEDALNRVPGLEIDRYAIGNSETGAVDDMMGQGTAAALERLVVVSQLAGDSLNDISDLGVDAFDNISTEFTNTTSSFIFSFLCTIGAIDTSDAKKFKDDLAPISKGGELQHLYKANKTGNVRVIVDDYQSAQPEERIRVIPDEGAPVLLVEENSPDSGSRKEPEPVQPDPGAPIVVAEAAGGSDALKGDDDIISVAEEFDVDAHGARVHMGGAGVIPAAFIESPQAISAPFHMAVDHSAAPANISVTVTAENIVALSEKDSISPHEQQIIGAYMVEYAQRSAESGLTDALTRLEQAEADLENYPQRFATLKGNIENLAALLDARLETGYRAKDATQVPALKDQVLEFDVTIDGKTTSHKMSMREIEDSESFHIFSPSSWRFSSAEQKQIYAAGRAAYQDLLEKTPLLEGMSVAQAIDAYNEKSPLIHGDRGGRQPVSENFASDFHKYHKPIHFGTLSQRTQAELGAAQEEVNRIESKLNETPITLSVPNPDFQGGVEFQDISSPENRHNAVWNI